MQPLCCEVNREQFMLLLPLTKAIPNQKSHFFKSIFVLFTSYNVMYCCYLKFVNVVFNVVSANWSSFQKQVPLSDQYQVFSTSIHTDHVTTIFQVIVNELFPLLRLDVYFCTIPIVECNFVLQFLKF